MIEQAMVEQMSSSSIDSGCEGLVPRLGEVPKQHPLWFYSASRSKPYA